MRVAAAMFPLGPIEAQNVYEPPHWPLCAGKNVTQYTITADHPSLFKGNRFERSWGGNRGPIASERLFHIPGYAIPEFLTVWAAKQWFAVE